MSGSWISCRSLLTRRSDLGLCRTVAARPRPQTVCDVLEDGHVAEQCVVLEDETGAPLLDAEVGGVLAVEEHAALVRELEPAKNAKQGGLARAGGAEQRRQRPRRDHQADGLQRGGDAELLGDLVYLDLHGGPRPLYWNYDRFCRHEQ